MRPGRPGMAGPDPAGYNSRAVVPSRALIRTLVVLTTLLCLGVGGWGTQTGWARHLARKRLDAIKLSGCLLSEAIGDWSDCPWYGRFDRSGWTPRRTYVEFFRLATGQDHPDDPQAWKVYFKAHPVLAWDEKLGRLVDVPMKPGEAHFSYDHQGRITYPNILLRKP